MRCAPAARSLISVLLIAAVWPVGGCKPASDVSVDQEPEETGQSKLDDVFVFPPSLHAGDESVNTIIAEAMRCCARGDYASFRLLWTAKEEPITREEYEQGFNAVRKIEIRALQRVVIADQEGKDPNEIEPTYVTLAEIDMDPTHRASKGESKRQVVLLVRREGHLWRLAHAPKPVRNWIQQRIAEETSGSVAQPPVRQEVKDG